MQDNPIILGNRTIPFSIRVLPGDETLIPNLKFGIFEIPVNPNILGVTNIQKTK
ncbi:MAG: hypothetical protein ACJAY8_000749 [Sphingobacteriales bacterium]|jgi:hypothetical protein